MEHAITALVVTNLLLFISLAAAAFHLSRREPSARVRLVSVVATATSAAFALGAAQRLAQQAVRLGWIAEQSVPQGLRFAKSLAILACGIAAAASMRRLLADLRESERVVDALAVNAAKLPRLNDLSLTPREREVLALLSSGVISDHNLASALGISVHTAHSHVRNIMKKADVSSRRDLIIVAHRSV